MGIWAEQEVAFPILWLRFLANGLNDMLLVRAGHRHVCIESW